MKKEFNRSGIIIITVLLALSAVLFALHSMPHYYEGTYVGQYGWNVMPKEQALQESSRIFMFEDKSGQVTRFKAEHTEDYDIQNQLMVGYEYSLETQQGKITDLKLLDDPGKNHIKPIVKGEAGKRTLKNFLKIAMEPVGCTEYIYGGAWNWQDDSGAPQAQTIGLPHEWPDFFNEQDAHFLYDDEDNIQKSFSQYQGINGYYYAGADCSGYVGWALYNLLNTESGGESYVDGCMISENLDTEHHLGQFTADKWELRDLKPGDIISTDEHVWIYMGGCSDGSGVILHSTVISSRADGLGGGVQLSALDPSGNENCEAFQIVKGYMSTCYPKWYSRYEPVLKDYDTYVHFPREDYGGLFRWDLSGKKGNLEDPEGYSSMNAAEILADLFR